MPKKRKVADPNNDEQTNEGAPHGTEEGSDAKRAKLLLQSDTTLQDLPMEVLDAILVKAVISEVKSYHQSLWNEKIDEVLDRLKLVSATWDIILSAPFLRTAVQRLLDGTGEQKAMLEILVNVPMPTIVYDVTAMKDELFILCRPNAKDYVISVYDRNNLNAVKCTIPLPGLHQPWGISACNVSNCVYALNEEGDSCAVYRLSKGNDDRYIIDTWITQLKLELPLMSVAANGTLLLLSRPNHPDKHVVSFYSPAGLLLDRFDLDQDTLKFRFISGLLARSDGGCVVVLINGNCNTELVDLDANGRIIRRHASKLDGETNVTYVDTCGRILLVDGSNDMELLDRDFNVLALERERAAVRVLKLVGFPSVKNFGEHRSEICSVPFSYFTADENRRLCIYRITNT